MVVPEWAAGGVRLDRVLTTRIEGLTRSQAKRLIDLQHVTVDGKPPKAGTVLRGGERIRVVPLPPETFSVEAEAIPVEVLHQDEDLVVIVKPADLVVHPAVGHPRGTLVNALAHLGAAGGDPVRPGIVHRLDRGTSGVMVVARHVRAHAALAAQFQAHTVEKRYTALVAGRPPVRGRFETLFGRHPVDRQRYTTRVKEGRTALTEFEVRERAGEWAWVDVRLHTGRTHQVRVHFSEHGYPLLGDPVYGRAARDAATKAVAEALGRPALHARVLGFDHPRTGERVRFEAAVPSDLADAWRALRELCGGGE